MFRIRDPNDRKRRIVRSMTKREIRLTRREREVVVLVGRDHLSYRKAGRQLAISPRTVRHYAERIRDMVGSALPPQKALSELFHSSPGLFTDAA